jgi:hypothetical protein
MENWNIKFIDVGYKIGRDVYIFRKTPRGTEFLKSDGTTEEVPTGSAIAPNPFTHFEPELLQKLADELSIIGYKPQKGFMEGKLEGTERHLEDMRKLLKLTNK